MEKKLGCLSVGGVMGAVLALLLIVGVIMVSGGAIFSPGELNAERGEMLGGVTSHSELSRQCSACHVSPWQGASMDDRCLACHTNVADQLPDANTLHGALMSNGAVTCRECHSEHKGTDAPLTTMSTTDFPHDVVGFSLQAHATFADGTPFACQDCHTETLTQLDVAVCSDCHQTLDAAFVQFHTAAFGVACLDCHDGIDTYGADFDHNRYFKLEGEHASGTCGGCHQGARTIAEFRDTPQDCYACHAESDIHAGKFGQDCAVCHTPTSWEQTSFDHALTNFPLVGKHSNVECEACHRNNEFVGTPTDCVACHADIDPHNGEFGTDCAACHTAADWEQVTFDHASFPLEDGHANLECEACHQGGEYRGTSSECVACHAQDDAHNGEFGTDCAVCHAPTKWDQAVFDHARTAFPLTGAHSSVACESCHVNKVYQGTPQQCVACHADPVFHAGAFGTDCASCHSTSAWRPAQYRGSHPVIADEGGRGINHGRTTCSTCHPSTVYQYTCLACHSDNQGGEGGEDD